MSQLRNYQTLKTGFSSLFLCGSIYANSSIIKAWYFNLISFSIPVKFTFLLVSNQTAKSPIKVTNSVCVICDLVKHNTRVSLETIPNLICPKFMPKIIKKPSFHFHLSPYAAVTNHRFNVCKRVLDTENILKSVLFHPSLYSSSDHRDQHSSDQ